MLRQGIVYLVALVLSICVHEYGHALVADRLGDRLPRADGRVTLNPLVHLDVIGTLVLPLVAVFSGPAIGSRILGWGKPVRISLSRRDLNPRLSLRTAHALIALAGPLMNVLFALVLSVVFVGLLKSGRHELATAVAQVIYMNIGLCLFNVLPIPPLDGGAILARVLPRSMEPLLEKLNQYGFVILLALLLTGILARMMWPAAAVGSFWLRTLAGWAGA